MPLKMSQSVRDSQVGSTAARQRVDERVHVAGVEIVLLVPGGGRQHDVRIQAGGGHAEIQGHQQIQLAVRRGAPLDL
jgi:hypothetical protein